MISKFPISPYQDSKIPVVLYHRYSMNEIWVYFPIPYQENSTFLEVNYEIILLAQFLKDWESFLKLISGLDKDQIICVSSIPYSLILDSLLPLADEILKVDIEEPRTQRGPLVDTLSDSDVLISHPEIGIFVELLQKL